MAAKHRLAKGHCSPQEAANMRHDPHVLLGEHDSTYHGHDASPGTASSHRGFRFNVPGGDKDGDE